MSILNDDQVIRPGNECPIWCSSPAGHPYTDDAIDGSYVARYHEDGADLGAVTPGSRCSSFSGLAQHAVTVGISCEEQAVTDAGPSVLTAPRITLYTENPVLTATEARQVADLLSSAADRLDEITGGER